MNYAALLQAVIDTTSNNETTFVANIPVFVRTAEQVVYNSVQLSAIRKNAVAAMDVGDKYMALPGDYLATFSFAVIDPVTHLLSYALNKDVSFLREAFPDDSVRAMPTHYAQFDPFTFVVGPVPDQAYSVELNYFYYPSSIVDAGTSWLGDNYEMVLLYGTLREAGVFMKQEEDVQQMYENKFKEYVALLKVYGDGKTRRDTYRSGQTRIQVT